MNHEHQRAMLGQLIRKHREAKDLSQEELSFEAEIHRTYVSQLERGLQSPTIEVLRRICSALDIKTSALLAELEFLEAANH